MTAKSMATVMLTLMIWGDGCVYVSGDDGEADGLDGGDADADVDDGVRLM